MTKLPLITILIISLISFLFLPVAVAQDDYGYQYYPLNIIDAPVIVDLNVQAVDQNQNGLYDYLQVNLDLDIQERGHYFFKWALLTIEGEEITNYGLGTMLKAGKRKQDIFIPSMSISRSQLDGPYLLRIDVVKDYKEIIDRFEYQTQAFLAKDFESQHVP